MALDPKLQDLLDYETWVMGNFRQLSTQHKALQDLGYDEDLRILRKTLDEWLDLHVGASEWLSLAKQEVRAARYQHRKAWQDAVKRPATHMDANIHTGSYEERRVRYEIDTDTAFRTLDILERVVDTVTEFKYLLRTMLDHWNARRSDVKFESQTRQRIPGQDYAVPDQP